jgi:phosphatidate phosphatase PAH1
MGRPPSRWLSILGPALFLLACGSERDGFDETPKDDGPGKIGDKDPGTTNPPGTQPPGSGQKCAAMPACNGNSSPTLGPKRDFKHTTSRAIVFSGDPHHRGRDQIVIEGQAQWVIGKFTYSMNDKDLKDEEVDIYLERACGGQWEKLGTATTTNDDQHPEVEGVPDTGGRIYFEIPKDKALALGRHRVRLVVAGDQSTTDLLIDVVPKQASVFVSDVDGTLTESENAEYPALLTGDLPNAQPDAPAVLKALADRGYRPIYVTARPEWLTGRTREFLDKHDFPRGIIHTTTGLTGALNGAAAEFKSKELEAIVAKGLTIAWAFGNRESDTDAYEAAKIEPKDHRIFLQVDDKNGGRRIEAYKELLPAVTAAPKACQ